MKKFLGKLLEKWSGKDSATPSVQKKTAPIQDFRSQASQAVAQERWEDAIQLYEQAIAASPGEPSLLVGLGFSALEAGRPKKALADLTKAARLLPQSPDAWFLLGRAQLAVGFAQEAAGSWRRLLEIRPDFMPVYPDFLRLLLRLGAAQEALQITHQAVERDPDRFEYRLYHANLLFHMHESEAAIVHYLHALQFMPESADILANLGVAYRQSGDLEKALLYARKAIDINAAVPEFFSNYLFLLQSASDVDIGQKFMEHQRYARIFEEPCKPFWPVHQNMPDPSRRLRIGYVSGDFCDHALRFFIEPVLNSHDHENFEIFCFYNNQITDEHTLRLKKQADHWIDCAGWSDADLFADIQQRGIDILVDLSGHTAHNRLPVFARKPAPIQMTWLGYQSTTGLTAMDWRITDHSLDPEGMTERFNSERLLRLSAAAAFAMDDQLPVFPNLPCLQGEPFTFGCLHNPSKVTLEVLDTWARILVQAPLARLLLGNATDLYAEKVRAHMHAHGVDAQRLVFVERRPLQGYLDLHARIDLMLDTFPYNGGTTTLHAVAMGVPTIVLHSDSAISRVGEAVMRAYGLSDFCSPDIDAYVAQAVRWSGQPDELARLRRMLPAQVARQNAQVAQMFTRSLESAWRDIWREWCEARASAQ